MPARVVLTAERTLAMLAENHPEHPSVLEGHVA